MMIKSIELKSFQSHKDSELNFVKGINIISGSSNSGKSSVIKALNLVMNNEPAGNDFINYNSKECKVKVEIDNNIIERIKSGKENSYIINDKKLEAIGQSVPEEIKQLNFNELNLQMQFDKFFLLQDSAGERARKLNQIINLEVIDESIKKIKSKVSKKKNGIEYLENDIDELRSKIKEYNYLDEVEDIIIKTELLEENKNKISDKINKLQQYKMELNNYQNELNKYKDISIKKELINKLKIKINEYNKLNEKINLLKQFKNNIMTIKELDKNIYNNKELKRELLKSIDVCPFYKVVCPLGESK